MKLKLFILIAIMFSHSDKNPEKPNIKIEKGGLYNPFLPFVNAPEGWSGNKVNNRNEFQNIESIRMPSFWDVIRWKLKKNPQEKEKKADQYALNVLQDTTFFSSKNDMMVWLGHSTFLIRINGLLIMTDPVFYDVPLVKRHHGLPFDPSLIKGLDYILISHNHRDHCDKKSLKLLGKNNPDAIVLAGLGMEKLLGKWISNTIQEAGWFQKYKTDSLISFVYLPAQHWSKRGLTDTNKQRLGFLCY
ncbi:MAG: hypothetical protein HC905_02575 [Bacteroidales bacterium]|nr:hypothetical protein [Bacteroidales bacterium]